MIKIFESGSKEDALKEIRSTDDQIRKIIPGKPVYFRAPYGLWKSKISNYLNKNMVRAGRYTGPFHWDIGGHDYRLWEKNQTAESCALSYLEEIEQKKKGIILMHDSSADVEKTKQNNRTFETLKILIPLLKDRGYRFVGLDKVQVSNTGSDRIKRLLRSIPDMYSLKRQASLAGFLLLSLWKALTRS
jgi:peptidoglycan/xylan/chitin deacetylase (PgdA/CDA1 family)